MTWKDEIKKYEGPESERYRTLSSAYNPDPDEEDRLAEYEDSVEYLVEEIEIECKRILDHLDTITDKNTDKLNLVRGLNTILEAYDIITENE